MKSGMFSLTEEHLAVREAARSFAKRHLLPGVIQRDKHAHMSDDLLREVGVAGLMGIQVSPRYGGAGLDSISYALSVEEVARVDAAMALFVSINNSLVCWLIEHYGSPEQRDKYLPALVSGEMLSSFCLSEPEAGSDAALQKTTALLKGDHYLLNGVKNWVTGGKRASLHMVIAQKAPGEGHKGIGIFLVECSAAGISTGPEEDKMGLRSSDTCSVMFQDVKLPLESHLSGEDSGFSHAMKALTGGRIGIAAQAVGIAQGALDRSLQYAQERETFGKKIAAHQATKFKLATMGTQLEAARLLTLRAAHLKDSGKDYLQASSLAKLYASEVCMGLTTEAVQIHGGYGYVREYHVERMMRDAKVTQIYEGTSEVQRMVIARKILE